MLLYKKIINNNEGDVIIKCKDGEIKGISFILKQNDVIKSVLSDIYQDTEITLLNEYSVESVKYFLHNFYSDSNIFIERDDHKLLLYVEFIQICDILCYTFKHNYTILMEILNSQDKYLIDDISKILKDNTENELILLEKDREIFIDYLINKIKFKQVKIQDLDIPYEYFLIIIENIMTKCAFFKKPSKSENYIFIEKPIICENIIQNQTKISECRYINNQTNNYPINNNKININQPINYQTNNNQINNNQTNKKETKSNSQRSSISLDSLLSDSDSSIELLSSVKSIKSVSPKFYYGTDVYVDTLADSSPFFG